jgi:hypothetical protein
LRGNDEAKTSDRSPAQNERTFLPFRRCMPGACSPKNFFRNVLPASGLRGCRASLRAPQASGAGHDENRLEDWMKALQVALIALPILAAACAQPAPTALKSFDSVFDAQYVRTASTPVAALP